jgi:hypothetical protein
MLSSSSRGNVRIESGKSSDSGITTATTTAAAAAV